MTTKIIQQLRIFIKNFYFSDNAEKLFLLKFGADLTSTQITRLLGISLEKYALILQNIYFKFNLDCEHNPEAALKSLITDFIVEQQEIEFNSENAVVILADESEEFEYQKQASDSYQKFQACYQIMSNVFQRLARKDEYNKLSPCYRKHLFKIRDVFDTGDIHYPLPSHFSNKAAESLITLSTIREKDQPFTGFHFDQLNRLPQQSETRYFLFSLLRRKQFVAKFLLPFIHRLFIQFGLNWSENFEPIFLKLYHRCNKLKKYNKVSKIAFLQLQVFDIVASYANEVGYKFGIHSNAVSFYNNLSVEECAMVVYNRCLAKPNHLPYVSHITEYIYYSGLKRFDVAAIDKLKKLYEMAEQNRGLSRAFVRADILLGFELKIFSDNQRFSIYNDVCNQLVKVLTGLILKNKFTVSGIEQTMNVLANNFSYLDQVSKSVIQSPNVLMVWDENDSFNNQENEYTVNLTNSTPQQRYCISIFVDLVNSLQKQKKLSIEEFKKFALQVDLESELINKHVVYYEKNPAAINIEREGYCSVNVVSLKPNQSYIVRNANYLEVAIVLEGIVEFDSLKKEEISNSVDLQQQVGVGESIPFDYLHSYSLVNNSREKAIVILYQCEVQKEDVRLHQKDECLLSSVEAENTLCSTCD